MARFLIVVEDDTADEDEFVDRTTKSLTLLGHRVERLGSNAATSFMMKNGADVGLLLLRARRDNAWALRFLSLLRRGARRTMRVVVITDSRDPQWIETMADHKVNWVCDAKQDPRLLIERVGQIFGYA